MPGYNGTSLAFAEAAAWKDCFAEIEGYLSAEDGYWKNHDIWKKDATAFAERRIRLEGVKGSIIADFSTISEGRLKSELKYYALWSLSTGVISASTFSQNYRPAVKDLGEFLQDKDCGFGITEIVITEDELTEKGWSAFHKDTVLRVLDRARTILSDIYDIGDETEKDVWRALRIPGARLSAAQKRAKPTLRFNEIPDFYKAGVKRYMRRMVVKRSWSHCSEMLRYIRTFFRLFYENQYEDGFLKSLNRFDIEKYLEWIAEAYENDNATYASKSVSFIREYLDYIQMAEYPEAPEKDVYRLIYDDDIPKRERTEDTFEKIRYIPEPIRIQLDANVSAIEPREMQPLYVLLRETGWRGTDILNLRYDNCLDYVWDKEDTKYVPYLCGEITKTGIPLLKIPIREDVAEMVEGLKKEAADRSTEQNNPERYLFNTYKGVNLGLPYSKMAFANAVQDMINRKGILDADGKPYHFRTHSLRHTRATEYAEQGMPIGVIQRMLGHCSLQMSLHYAKVSDNVLYKKWKETEALGILHLTADPPEKMRAAVPAGTVSYECVREGLDAVRVPFGVCFKPSKLQCKTQLKHCLECASFCSTHENLEEYREEIRRVEAQIALGKQLCRPEWVDKNQAYLELLMAMADRICQEGIVHKNGSLREEPNA
ncbi:MAG: tyrosine-type recombinase/integrase [Blautia sp.]|nr:tyrosine-type recombinase/integrase [Blautia sp.]